MKNSILNGYLVDKDKFWSVKLATDASRWTDWYQLLKIWTLVHSTGNRAQVRNHQHIKIMSMPYKHQNSENDFIVIGDKRRWFDTSLGNNDSSIGQHSGSNPALTAKWNKLTWTIAIPETHHLIQWYSLSVASHLDYSWAMLDGQSLDTLVP